MLCLIVHIIVVLGDLVSSSTATFTLYFHAMQVEIRLTGYDDPAREFAALCCVAVVLFMIYPHSALYGVRAQCHQCASVPYNIVTWISLNVSHPENIVISAPA